MRRALTTAKQNLRHVSRLLRGKQDPNWQFYRFERAVHVDTWRRHGQLLQWALGCAAGAASRELPERYAASEDPVVRQGFVLAEETKKDYHVRYRAVEGLRILIHVPPSDVSPGGFSLFSNLISALQFIGIPTRVLGWSSSLEQELRAFRPTVLMTSDHHSYLSRIDWDMVAAYRRSQELALGLTASLEEHGNTPVAERLDWARRHGLSFYYCFQAADMIHARPAYRPFIDSGYPIHCIEFGANPLLYHPVPDIRRDLHFVFLASSNQDKWQRYFRFLPELVARYPGMIDGPGWSYLRHWAPPQTHRFLYARATVGINLHISESIDWPSELNERTYILAACGVPQLVDDAKLLEKRFSPGCFFVASTPEAYLRLFERVVDDPAEAARRALKAQAEVFASHTTFARASCFVDWLRDQRLIAA